MSLRREVHSAFEEIAPPTAGMPERVVQTVLAEHVARRRKERMLSRIRVPLSLAAIFVVIALVAAVLVGGRLIQDWNAVHKPAPAGQSNTPTIAQLEAVPLTIAVLKASDACPADGPLDQQGRYGLGPVHGIGALGSDNSWGTVWHIAFDVDTSVHGFVLIRGRDLKTQQPVYWEGSTAYGPVEPTNAQLHTEMLITMPAGGAGKTVRFPITSALANGHSNCVGMQIDGDGFSEYFVGGA